jgi:hypothetical protein
MIEEVFDMMDAVTSYKLQENEEEWREAVLPENCYFCYLFLALYYYCLIIRYLFTGVLGVARHNSSVERVASRH